jgi:ABC-type dipeptide/oligopeptide/nickel transport system permease subunit
LAVIPAIGAEWLAPYDPATVSPGGINEPFASPSLAYPFGTDSLGRDVLSRVLYGARISLLAGLASIALALSIGLTAGLIAGYIGGMTEGLIMRSVDMLLSFPGILIALLIWLALGAGWPAVLVAVALINIPLFARQTRANVVALRNADYVVAARAVGATDGYIMTRVVLPAIIAPTAVLATLALGAAILEVAGLAFLGISGEIDVPEWGNMLRQAQTNFERSAWPAVAPGVAISLTVVGFNLLGDGLRDALDPQSR